MKNASNSENIALLLQGAGRAANEGDDDLCEAALAGAEAIRQLEELGSHFKNAAKDHKCSECRSTLSWRFNGGNPAWFVIERGG